MRFRALQPKDKSVGKVTTTIIMLWQPSGGSNAWFRITGNGMTNVVHSATSYTGSLTAKDITGYKNWNTMVYPFWNKVFVGACKLRLAITRTNSTSAVNYIANMYKIAICPTTETIGLGGTSDANNFDKIMGQPFAKTRYITSGVKNTTTLTYYTSTGKITGVKPKYNDENYGADIADAIPTNGATVANPNIQWYWYYCIADIADTAFIGDPFIIKLTRTFYFTTYGRKTTIIPSLV